MKLISLNLIEQIINSGGIQNKEPKTIWEYIATINRLGNLLKHENQEEYNKLKIGLIIEVQLDALVDNKKLLEFYPSDGFRIESVDLVGDNLLIEYENPIFDVQMNIFLPKIKHFEFIKE